MESRGEQWDLPRYRLFIPSFPSHWGRYRFNCLLQLIVRCSPRTSCTQGRVFGKWLNHESAKAALTWGGEASCGEAKIRGFDLVGCVSLFHSILLSLHCGQHGMSSFLALYLLSRPSAWEPGDGGCVCLVSASFAFWDISLSHTCWDNPSWVSQKLPMYLFTSD